MFHRRPIARTALAAGALALLAGCATRAIDDNAEAAHAQVRTLGGVDFTWLATDAARAQARADVDATLQRPLSEDDAVRVALSHSPALQALLFDSAAASADATRSARLPNPVFAFERLASGGVLDQVEVTRALTLPLLELLLLPARARQADAVQQRLRLQLTSDVLHAAGAARVAWIGAVAAGQSMRYAAQVRDAADAASTLARRLEAAGNFSALQRAREEAFGETARIELAQARRAQRGARETLVRALGLDAGEAAALTLPEHLAALPDAPPAALQAALDQRLDLRLARARLDELARTQGLTRVTGSVDALDAGLERRGRTGQAREHGVTLSLPLPLFDPGDAARAGASARYEAALARTAALAVDAASRLRVADADRRDSLALARDFQDRLVPLQATIVGENLLRYNGMLASTFDLLADAREQARSVQRAIAAQRDFWLADAAFTSATLGIPDHFTEAP
jgi:outer membrane protein TolC